LINRLRNRRGQRRSGRPKLRMRSWRSLALCQSFQPPLVLVAAGKTCKVGVFPHLKRAAVVAALGAETDTDLHCTLRGLRGRQLAGKGFVQRTCREELPLPLGEWPGRVPVSSKMPDERAQHEAGRNGTPM